MDIEKIQEMQACNGILTGISFGVLTDDETGKLSVLSIGNGSEVSDPKLGLPNLTHQCSTCGAKDNGLCEGHIGDIKFLTKVLHPYFFSEVAQILNKICPACKSARGLRHKAVNLLDMLSACKYCHGKSYPSFRFKVSSNELFRKAAIVVEVVGKFSNKSLEHVLPDDFWDFIPNDPSHEDCGNKTNRRVLSHTQIRCLLKDVDPKIVRDFVSRTDALFLGTFPVTPNSHRVTEFFHPWCNGPSLVFDDRTRAYRKLVGYKGPASELGFRVMDCLKLSKLRLDKSNNDFAMTKRDPMLNTSCSKWMKEVILTKRSDHIFRTVVTGDPYINLNEIGIPGQIADNLLVYDYLNYWNWEKLTALWSSQLIEKGEILIKRRGEFHRIKFKDKPWKADMPQIGDIVYRPLTDGDIILINRPPSIHQHSLLGLHAKILPINSAVSINPICCAPLRGDFDGDCLHGFIPQSIESRVELRQLVALDKQLVNGQSGKNLLSLSHDCLTAAHLLLDEGILLDRFLMQQMEMFCLRQSELPAIVKAPLDKSHLWTGKQLFSTLLPPDFDYSSPQNGVHISKGEIKACPSGSSWLRGDSDVSLFEALTKHCREEVLDYLHASQQVLCEWLSHRGLSVSLLDLYLCSDAEYHKSMIDEVLCGLQEAERTCQLKQLMVESFVHHLSVNGYENQSQPPDESILLEVEGLCFEKQKSAALCRASVSAFKQVFRDIQNLAYQYADHNNTLLAMTKSGSRSGHLKVVQQVMCLGLQHSMIPLSFKLPHELSCTAWNNLKTSGSVFKDQDAPDCSKTYIPYAVVANSFAAGLNPLECFVHSVTSRDSSFKENADVPGTLNRRLMFFMRDLYTAYDGTVRSPYGNQLFQFCYNSRKDDSSNNKGDKSFIGCTRFCGPEGGQPVGALAACAISEAAYSALDQPVSVLEPSPLFNIKKVLESGLKKSNLKKTASLYLSRRLAKWRHGFEYAALEVKNYLEGLLFSDIVSTVMIVYSQENSGRSLNPWVCHFHVCKEIVKRRRLKVHSIVDALNKKCAVGLLPKLQIALKHCSVDDAGIQNRDTFCITAAVVESTRNSCADLDAIRDILVPDLLGSVIKGLTEVKKVDILWNELSDESMAQNCSSGELYLKVYLSSESRKANLWCLLMDCCLPIMDLVDWTRSHPDDTHDMFSQYGIDSCWRYFLQSLKSAVQDVGKTVLPEHLLLVADCLSVTGEFVGLSARGMTKQKAQMSVSAPFLQACFSSPGASFVKAAKTGASDQLQGSLDALAWGIAPPFGTGGKFELIYSGKGHEVEKPMDVFSCLTGHLSFHDRNTKPKVPNGYKLIVEESGITRLQKLNAEEGFGFMETKAKILLQSRITVNDLQKLTYTVSFILRKYSIGQKLNDSDKEVVETMLRFHPERGKKVGNGLVDIKVGYHPEHKESRCFILVRSDDTVEDFSFRKCFRNGREMIASENSSTKRHKMPQLVSERVSDLTPDMLT